MPLSEQTLGAGRLPTGAWCIDPSTSSVRFTIKHFALAKLSGHFTQFAGALELGEQGASAAGSVLAASIDTGEEVRDAHLRESSDFFDVERHPEISFRSTRVLIGAPRGLRVEGELTMRGITREIALQGELREDAPGQAGEPRIAIELRGELNRKDFGLTWNQALDAGGALLGNKVKIELSLSASPDRGEPGV